MYSIINRQNSWKKCSYIVLSLLLAFTAINVYASAALDENNQKVLHDIQGIIDHDRVAYQMPGIQVSIIFPGRTVPHDFVSGNIELNGHVPISPDHLFQIGSETKSFTAATLLLLEAEGKLSLDDPIGKWLPQLPTAWQGITVRQLLNQDSRLYNYTDSDEFKDQLFKSEFKKQWTSNELVQFAFDRSRCTTWCYSNTNFVLAGMIIEAVTGDSVKHAMNSRLFRPLHLHNTYYIPDMPLPRMAHGYSMNGTFQDEPKDVTELNLSWGRTAGAIISNSHDMAIWLRNLLNGKLLPKKQLTELMTTVKEGEEGSNYGLGIEQDFESFGQETWEHNGGTLGYSSWMVWLKESDLIITIDVGVTAKDRTDINSLLRDLTDYLLQAKGEARIVRIH